MCIGLSMSYTSFIQMLYFPTAVTTSVIHNTGFPKNANNISKHIMEYHAMD